MLGQPDSSALMAQDTYPHGQVGYDLGVNSMMTYYNSAIMIDSSLIGQPVDPLDELFGPQLPHIATHGVIDYSLFGLNDSASEDFQF